MQELKLSLGGAHLAEIKSTKTLSWEAFAAWLTRTPPEVDDKAVNGWYVPAEFSPEYRDSDNFVARYAITFDFDKVDLDTEARVKEVWGGLAFVLYTTFSHTEDKPRFRVVIPLSRPAKYDEYQAVVRKVAVDIGIEYVARESFVPAQMMFVPTRKKGGVWHSFINPGAMLDVDGVLNEYEDWTDHTQWPHREDGDGVHAIGETQTPPAEKPGIVGEFCRAFDIPAAIERFGLPYVPTNTERRYTYTGGSRPEGAIIYDDGQKLHSHHDSDPAHGQNNSFDLVRLHKFGALDAPGSNALPVTERASFKAMVSLAREQPELATAAAESCFNDLGPLVEEELIVRKDLPDRFRVLSPEEFTAGKPQEWIIKDILPRAEICVIYGESGSGKSFLTLDASAAITRGIEWRGRKTSKGRVVYVAAEGAGGFKKRLQAYAQESGCDIRELPGIVPNAPNLLEAQDVGELTASILQWGRPDVVVIDTLSAAIPGGNENSGEDMGLALSHCKFIHAKTGALVVLIHHSGKDATRGARGWSGLRAAADAEIEVVRNGDFRVAAVTKMKDGGDGEQLPFKLKTISLGVFDNEPQTSCVVEHTEEMPQEASRRAVPSGANQTLVMDTLRTMAAGSSVHLDDLREGVKTKMPKPEGRDERNKAIERALTGLISKGLAFMQGEDRVALTPVVEVGDDSWLQ